MSFKSILVVGGGTAGWLAAAYLQRTLCNNPAHPVAITLVESPEIGAIGVGEATVPTLRQTLRLLDIPETTLFTQAEATLKNGIRFIGWRNGGDVHSDRYDHPFENPIGMHGFPMGMHWLNLKQDGMTDAECADAICLQTALFDALRSPKQMQSPNYEAPLPYAYHLDATLLAQLLRNTATARGVQHIEGKVVSVAKGDDGIRSVTLENGRELAADLFVDCTGFRSLLIGELESPWISFADSLLCDRAVACPVAYDDSAPLRPYTTCTAKDAGWTWEIDLQSRRGTGYVYSSAFCDEAQAEATLRAHNGTARPLAEMCHLKMRTGHRARMWEKNCLALGLASGFLEPLESTGIYLVEYALQTFIDYLPAAGKEGRNQQRYNALMSDMYQELRDFVVMHYVLSQRRDSPFWRAYAEDGRIPASLREQLELWDEKIPSVSDINRRVSLFGPANWFYILAGMQRLPQLGAGALPFIPPELSRQSLAHVAAARKNALLHSPSLHDYVRKVRSAIANAPRKG